MYSGHTFKHVSEISVYVNKKQKIFWAKQDDLGEVTPEQLEELKAKCNTLHKNNTQFSIDKRNLEKREQELAASSTNKELDEKLYAMEQKVVTLKEQLAISEEKAKNIDMDAKGKICKLFEKYKKECVSRRKKGKNAIDMIAEGGDIKVKQAFKKVGIENEEPEILKRHNTDWVAIKSMKFN